MTVTQLPWHSAPEANAFSCCGCGSCCQCWAVPVYKEDRQRIEVALAAHPHPVYGASIPLMTDGGREFLLLVNGRCAYLQPDNLCWLHGAFGPEVKPFICRAYPRRTTITPCGAFTSLSLSCHTAAAFLAAPPPGPVTTGTAQSTDSPPPPFHLRKERPLTPPEAEAVEDLVIRILRAPDPGLSARLRRIDEALRECGEKSGKELKRHLKSAAEKTAPAGDAPPLSEHVTFLSSLLRHRRNFLAAESAVQEHVRRIFNTLDGVFALDDPAARPPASIRVNRALSGTWEKGRGVAEPILVRYFELQVWSKHFTHAFGIIGGFQVLCLLFAVIRLLASAYAIAESKPLAAAHVVKAIAEVEREFTHASVVVDFWREVLANPLCDKPWFLPVVVL